MKRHVPLRRCISCRSTRPQAELIRLVRDEDAWRLDLSRKAAGRGAWICADKPECREVKRLKRFLRGQAESIAAELEHDVKQSEPAMRRVRIRGA